MTLPAFKGKRGVFTLNDYMGQLQAGQPARERCVTHGRTKCRAKVRYWWVRDGERDIGYCAKHAVESFGEAFECEGCKGHPAGPGDPMGKTFYCDGSCLRP